MRTSATEVHSLLSVFNVDEVTHAHVGAGSFAADNVSEGYDRTQLEATDVKSAKPPAKPEVAAFKRTPCCRDNRMNQIDRAPVRWRRPWQPVCRAAYRRALMA